MFDPSISLGIDYSYEEPGFCISKRNEQGKEIVLHVSCINFLELEKERQKITKSKKRIPFTKDEKREMIAEWIHRLYKEYRFTIVVVERIRLFSNGFISKRGIVAFAELILTIKNACKNIEGKKTIPVYTVDTRSWKSRMIGLTKEKKKDPKAATIKWAMQFMTLELLEKRNGKVFTDNEADAIAQSMIARHIEAQVILQEVD